MILLATGPNGQKTRVSLDVFASDVKAGGKPLYRFESDLDRPAESRPDWAAVYALYVLYQLIEGIERDVDNGGASLYSRAGVRQAAESADAVRQLPGRRQ